MISAMGLWYWVGWKTTHREKTPSSSDGNLDSLPGLFLTGHTSSTVNPPHFDGAHHLRFLRQTAPEGQPQ